MKARIDHKGLFACFKRDLVDEAGEAVNVEISAVAWNGHRLVFGSDKSVPGDHRSPIFALDIDDHAAPVAESLSYYTAGLITSAEKYEDFALTDGGDYLIATTGFDRADSQSAAQDVYNRLLIWPCGEPDSVKLIADRDNDGVLSSLGLREDLAQALGAPYFKVEGLSSVPGEAGGDPLLLFGIREVGQSHEDFSYVAQVVAAPYRVDDEGMLEFTGLFELVYEFEPAAWPDVRFEVGLSSLEYDPATRRLYFLTSFEVDDGQGGDRLGAYLWALSFDDFHAGRAPVLVADDTGEPLEFANKAEGVAVLPDGRLFVVYDPDRALALEAGHHRDAREPHEAPYTVLSIMDHG
ncbi:MAG: hypothetical protein CMP08_10340 [Xanthomonadales bacterium]|nr:hypothetical protein [Xanthomonadales bacterium]